MSATDPTPVWSDGLSRLGESLMICDSVSRIEKIVKSTDAQWLKRVVANASNQQKAVTKAAQIRLKKLEKEAA